MFIALDIETRNIPEPQLSAIVAREMQGWAPPANFKDEQKIAERRAEAEQKIRQRSALMDASEIGVVSVNTGDQALVFQSIDTKQYQVPGNTVVSCGTEEMMLLALRAWADPITLPSTTLVGHNLLGFDLPRLRAAYLRNGLRFPTFLSPPTGDEAPQAAYDTMRQFVRWYSADLNGERFVSLKEVSERLKLPSYKAVCDGAMVPTLLDTGEVQKVLIYAATDTAATLAIAMILRGEASELR